MKEKSLNISCVNEAKKNISDLEIFGNGDTFKLICKASSQEEGWMKSTKAMEIDNVGCVVQVSTQQRNPDCSYALAEAITFVPGVSIRENANGERFLKKKKLLGKIKQSDREGQL